MKTSIFNFTLLSLFILCICSTNAQQPPDWNTAGNLLSNTEFFGATPASINPIQFTHFADLPISRFEWHTTLNGITDERMRLTRAGWLGIGIPAPVHQLHVHEPAVGVTGNTGIIVELIHALHSFDPGGVAHNRAAFFDSSGVGEPLCTN